MKNLFVLPTDKPSRLHLESNGLKLSRLQNTLVAQNIYITSDEEIKEGDYCVDGNDIYGPYEDGDIATNKFIKIILTTDSQLIRYGVQAIDDEFLEWFVKNPSCERVEVEDFPMTEKYNSKGEYVHRSYWVYKIIIPRTTQQIINQDYAGGLEMGQIPAKEEPNIIDQWLEKNGNPEIAKQVELEAEELYGETLEEVAKKLKGKELFKESNDRARETLSEIKSLPKQETLEEAAENYNLNTINAFGDYESFIAGAKWQKEQDKKLYSEEEMIQTFHYGHQIGMNTVLSIQSQHSPQPIPKPDLESLKKEWLEQFKKK
jgi:hypothetical protein